MKKLRLYRTLTAAAITMGFAATSIGTIHAASIPERGSKHELAAAIAHKFNLTQGDVQKVIDEHHAHMDHEHDKRKEERLARAVAEGKLTQEQANAIKAKQREMRKKGLPFGGPGMGHGHRKFDRKDFEHLHNTSPQG